MNQLDTNELSVMLMPKSPSTGPMSVQPIEHAPTQQMAMAPTVGEQRRTPLPKKEQARAHAINAAISRILRRNSLRAQRQMQKR
ncbi:hypothetical protein [Bradyrhizobium sp. 2S1]|uniref:hypothetical protein n=1 Tax=Bradyrhizobium sp. 2S1 TaxID=1404429 RepID=UPI00140852D7|nr:hypothetical protein [Bradyrhizobium sp. 2S1]MCK7668133.1 hypothetical protein [Bradyrhizobium sp. 2S1]